MSSTREFRCLCEEPSSEKYVPYFFPLLGCCFANETQLKISLLHQHEIEDFKYHPEYFSGFVESINHPGLERHGFAHLDCPHGDYKDNGRFILGKIINGDELHLTAFQIPSRHTLYIPPNTIHSNDYLCGTWRTMLAVADIDRVVLKRRRADKNLEIFAFDFP